MSVSIFFQDHLSGNVCFGCGPDNLDGLQIKSYWEGEIGVCEWTPASRYCGWPGVLNGGIIATVIDCHCVNTATADAYRREGRELDSQPTYRYATGSLAVKYLKPTPMGSSLVLRAQVTEVKGRKTTLACSLEAAGALTVSAEVVAIRVYDSSRTEQTAAAFSQ